MPSTIAYLSDTIRRRPYTVLLTLVLLGLAVSFCRRTETDWDDVYLPAARHLRAGEPVVPDRYLYPPVSAWLAIPFTQLPHLPGKMAWYAVNVVSLLVVLTGAWHLTGGGRLQGDPPVPRREHLILLLGLLAGLYYAFDALTNQQTDLVIAALVVGGCLLLARGRDLGAAASFGVAAGMKCTPLLWAPYLAWRGRWRAAAAVVAVAVGINLLPDLTHPPADGEGRLKQWAVTYLKPMAGTSHDPGTWGSCINFNHSVAGVSNRWLTAYRDWQGDDFEIAPLPDRVSARVLKIIVYSACLLFVTAALFAARRRAGGAPPAGEYGLVLILMLMLSPMSSKPHFCTLLLPGFFLARAAVERRDLLPRLLLGGAILAGLVSNKDLVGRLAYDTVIWYGSVFWNAVLLFAGCAVVLLTRKQPFVATQHLPYRKGRAQLTGPESRPHDSTPEHVTVEA